MPDSTDCARLRGVFVVALAVAVAGCRDNTRPAADNDIARPQLPTSKPTGGHGWSSRLGQVVTVRGTARPEKFGAAVVVDESDGGGYLWLDGIVIWPDDLAGRRVSVTGRVIERHDLPVFIPREDQPSVQGIPMPNGTDLRSASHRYLLAAPQVFAADD